MEEYKLVDGSRIKGVTSIGISYLDDEGFAQFIDFAECYANFVRQKTDSDYWEHHKENNRLTDTDWERHLSRLERWREIGENQPLSPPWADGPYTQFHTEPPIRFKSLTREQFEKIFKVIKQAGWKLLDRG
jgi:hypothetical protein